jgi:hypothetical protein
MSRELSVRGLLHFILKSPLTELLPTPFNYTGPPLKTQKFNGKKVFKLKKIVNIEVIGWKVYFCLVLYLGYF